MATRKRKRSAAKALSLNTGLNTVWSSVLDQASFVLPKYAQRASCAERQAANRLLARVRGYVRQSGR